MVAVHVLVGLKGNREIYINSQESEDTYMPE